MHRKQSEIHSGFKFIAIIQSLVLYNLSSQPKKPTSGAPISLAECVPLRLSMAVHVHAVVSQYSGPLLGNPKVLSCTCPRSTTRD